MYCTIAILVKKYKCSPNFIRQCCKDGRLDFKLDNYGSKKRKLIKEADFIKVLNNNKSNRLCRQNKHQGRGSGMISKGYKYYLDKNHPKSSFQGYVAEHVLVMESHLGRHLEPGEVVHHIDRDRLNNDISNLKLYTSQSEHMRGHAALKSALLTIQGNEVLENRVIEFINKLKEE